jgi:hypothetical protein
VKSRNSKFENSWLVSALCKGGERLHAGVELDRQKAEKHEDPFSPMRVLREKSRMSKVTVPSGAQLLGMGEALESAATLPFLQARQFATWL